MLAEHWRKQRELGRNAPPTPRAIAEFEARHALSLPADFRTYLLTLNGLPEARHDHDWDNVDAEGFVFHALASLRAAAPSNRYFVFATNAIFLTDYAICLDASSAHHGEVVAVSTGLHELAPDFSEFVGLYVMNSEALYSFGTLIADS